MNRANINRVIGNLNRQYRQRVENECEELQRMRVQSQAEGRL